MSAIVITHTKFNRPPVQQLPRKGRLPKAVTSLLCYSRDRNLATHQEQQRQAEITKTQELLATFGTIANHYRHHLAALRHGGAL